MTSQISQEEREAMMKYVLENLDKSIDHITPVVSKELVSGIKSDYILLGESIDGKIVDYGAIFLVDTDYPKDSLEEAYSTFDKNLTFSPLIYKDGENFFRHVTKHKRKDHEDGKIIRKSIRYEGDYVEEQRLRKMELSRSKETYREGLHGYKASEMHNKIMFSPEERFLFTLNKTLQYYQPESKMLEECLTTIEYDPIIPSYVGKKSWNGHTISKNTVYKRDHQIVSRNDYNGIFTQDWKSGLLVPK